MSEKEEVSVKGNNQWKLISRVEHGGNCRSTFAMKVDGGGIVLVNTKQDGVYNESQTFVPQNDIQENDKGYYVARKPVNNEVIGGSRKVGVNQTVEMNSEF